MKIYLSAPKSYAGPLKEIFMNVYLAGAASAGNNGYLYKQCEPSEVMEIFLSGTFSRPYLEEHMMERLCVLESFFYVKEWMLPYIHDHWDFMLDSGAFTFMQSGEGGDTREGWKEYVTRYAKFITDHGIDLFFELDIDALVGLEKVEDLRKLLEDLTGKQPIPVWHHSRGKEYFLKMCEEYPYVALGGMAADTKYKNRIEKIFPWFISEARKRGTKIHALGYTSIKGMHKHRFDSVDSTAWLYGNRGGYLYHFNGRDIVKIEPPQGHQLKSRDAAIHNFREWVKFQHFAKANL